MLKAQRSHKKADQAARTLKIGMTLVLPLDVNTPNDFFCLFALSYRDLVKFSSHFLFDRAYGGSGPRTLGSRIWLSKHRSHNIRLALKESEPTSFKTHLLQLMIRV